MIRRGSLVRIQSGLPIYKIDAGVSIQHNNQSPRGGGSNKKDKHMIYLIVHGYLAVAGLFRVAYEDCKIPAKAVRSRVSVACNKFKSELRRSLEIIGQVPLQ